jgi:MFS family permease
MPPISAFIRWCGARHRPGPTAAADQPRHGRARAFPSSPRAAPRADRPGHTATVEDREFLCFVPLQLFNKEPRFSTLVGLLFALGTLLAILTTVICLPTIQSLVLEKEGIKGAAVAPIIGPNMMLWGIGGIFGYACFGFVTNLIGRRPTVALYNIGTLIAGLVLFLAVDNMAPFPYLLVIYRFFVLGVFSGHAVYIPELFPTHVRAIAVSFCNRGTRIITSFRPLVAGLLAAPFGGNFNKPAALMTCFALLSMYAMYLGQETRADPLPR